VDRTCELFVRARFAELAKDLERANKHLAEASAKLFAKGSEHEEEEGA
jgi:hypothetical protein